MASMYQYISMNKKIEEQHWWRINGTKLLLEMKKTRVRWVYIGREIAEMAPLNVARVTVSVSFFS